MIVYPNCKVNLGLNVTEKRPNGFHNLESVFYPVDYCDILEIIESDNKKTFFGSSGINIPGKADNNLCLKAYHLLANDFNIPSVKIHLHKIIPIGAGLGGGSSDASFTLLALNQIFKLGISNEKLLKYAEQLGADCPFFIINKPIFASGTGNIFETIELDLSSYTIVIVKPPAHVVTKTAFQQLQPHRKLPSIKDTIMQDISSWRELLENDFEKEIFNLHPEIGIIKEKLYDMGAVYASMSGSGSAVFALFKESPDLSNVFPEYTVWQK